MQASVIIRAYNAEATVARALESALRQEFARDEFEIIVIDDGSTDGTAGVLERYGGKTNVQILHQKNEGAVAAANVGFRMARGTYVGLLDCDDAYEPRFLAETTALFDADLVLDFVYTNYFEEYQGVRQLKQLTDLFQTIVDNSIYRRSSLERAGYWKEGVAFAEYDLLLRTLDQWKHAHIDKPLVTYFRRKESLTGLSDWVAEALTQLTERHPDKGETIAQIRSYALPNI